MLFKHHEPGPIVIKDGRGGRVAGPWAPPCPRLVLGLGSDRIVAKVTVSNYLESRNAAQRRDSADRSWRTAEQTDWTSRIWDRGDDPTQIQISSLES